MSDPILPPEPRFCDRPSGKIHKKAPPLPWTLPPKRASQPGGTKEVTCFACRKSSLVPQAAVSARCPYCEAYIQLDDVTLHSRSHRRNIKTWGTVYVEPRTRLTGLTIECTNMVLHGAISGDIICHGVCKIKAPQHIQGHLQAERLVVEKRCDTIVTNGITVNDAAIDGVLEATMTVTHATTIEKHGKFLGDLTTKHLIIQEGGARHGNLTRTY